MIDNNIYKHIIKNSKLIYFYGETIVDKEGNIVDCKILDINNSFEDKMNLNKEYIINNKVTNIIDNNFDWIKIIKEVIDKGNYSQVHYVDNFKDWFEIDIQKVSDKQFYVLMNNTYQIDEYTKTLLDVFPGGIWYKDKGGRYITSSKAMLYSDRVKDRYIKGKTDLEIQVSEELAKNIRNHDINVMNSKESEEYNTFFREDTVHSTQKHCVYNKQGEVIGTIGLYMDITDHENLKLDYENHKKLSDTLLQSIQDKLAYKDINGMYIYCNKSYLDYLGIEDEADIVGRYDKEIFKSNINNYNLISSMDKIVVETKLPLRYETNETMNGREYHFDIIKTPFFDNEGEVIGIIAVIRDITNQKLAKFKIKESEQQLNGILNGVQDAIILSEKDKIIYVNKAYEDIFGIKIEDVFKNPNIAYDTFTDEYKQILGEYNHEETYNLEININSKDGKNKWIWYKSYPIDSKNINGKKITIIRDITSKKEYDLELEKLKIEFFANITHELRTPLNLMFSSLQLIDLKFNSNEKNIDNYKKYIDIIKQNSLRLLKLVNNLIDSTKIDSGYLNYKYENGDIVYFIEQLFNSIETYANSKNIDLVFDTEVEEKIVAFDMDKLERVILNLLSNAIKFNKENGKIYLAMRDSENSTEISIKDTGIGIAEYKLESIFDRFIQVNNRMTKISEGSGIGLSLSKSLIEMQEGSIQVNSTLGEGTEFIVSIPDRIIKDELVNKSINGEYNSFVKKLEIEFADIY